MICVATSAWAEPVLQEYNASQKLAPAETLRLGPCDIDVAFAGAIADVELHQRIRNPGPGDLASTFDFELPAEAKLIGFALRERGTTTAVGVMATSLTQIADTPEAIGPDPAIVKKLGPSDLAGRDRYRAVVQPLAPDHEIMLAVRWTQAADIHDGALHLPLFAKLDGSACLVRVRATPGPGATVQRIRALGEVLPRTAPTFTLAGADASIAVELAFGRPEPIAWLHDENLGAGFIARALTVVAPPARAQTGARHTLLVIDTSRSMELVGRGRVRQVVKAIGDVLPNDAQVEAILYDRTAERVLGGWHTADASAFAAIDAALAKRPAQNGSDAPAALGLARTLVGEATRGQTMVVSISDAVFGGIDDEALSAALGSRADALDVHAIVLEPAQMNAPNAEALRTAVSHYGGSYVEVRADALDEALAGLTTWLRPGWVELAATGGITVPSEVRAGTGFTALAIVKRPGKVAVTGRSETALAITPRAAPAAPIAQLALAASTDADFGEGQGGTDAREHALLQHVAADGDHELAILSVTGRVAASRRQMIAGGGPYTRLVAVADPPAVKTGVARAVTTSTSALDRTIVKRMLVDQLQPHAYSCFQRAIATAPKLAGTAMLHIELGRGEVSRVTIEGIEPAFDACLVDAAYGMSPPLPTPGVNLDDRVIVNYPITFAVREDKPLVIAGDADSTTPLDIEAIRGGVPKRIEVDTSTPLGGLRPSRSP